MRGPALTVFKANELAREAQKAYGKKRPPPGSSGSKAQACTSLFEFGGARPDTLLTSWAGSMATQAPARTQKRRRTSKKDGAAARRPSARKRSHRLGLALYSHQGSPSASLSKWGLPRERRGPSGLIGFRCGLPRRGDLANPRAGHVRSALEHALPGPPLAEG